MWGSQAAKHVFEQNRCDGRLGVLYLTLKFLLVWLEQARELDIRCPSDGWTRGRTTSVTCCRHYSRADVCLYKQWSD